MKRVTPPAQLNLLAEQVGNFIEFWGFKKIHGMIWTHLYLSPTPLSAQELIARLRVSKALISLSMKDLIHYELITQTPESENKKNKFYTANPDVYGAIRGVLESREQKMINQINVEYQTLNQLQSDPRYPALIEKNQLQNLGEMIEGAREGLGSLINLSKIDPSFFKTFYKA